MLLLSQYIFEYLGGKTFPNKTIRNKAMCKTDPATTGFQNVTVYLLILIEFCSSRLLVFSKL